MWPNFPSEVDSRAFPSTNPSKPSKMSKATDPNKEIAVFALPWIAAFDQAQSPPPVRMPILLKGSAGFLQKSGRRLNDIWLNPT
jgi:hypothetical protein